MSARGPKKNNVLAGLFLVTSLVVAVVLSFWVSDLTDRFGKFAEYAVDFSLKDGAAGIEPGSPVLLGGKTVGRVESVNWLRGSAASDGRETATSIRVHIKIRKDIPIFSDAITQVERPILGGLASINITNPGGTPPEDPNQPAPKLVAEGQAIHGILAPGLLAQAGLGPEEIESFKAIIKQIDAASADIAKITAAFSPNAEPASRDIAELLASARRTVATAESDYNDLWSPRVTSALTNIDTISANGVEITETVQAAVDNANTGIDEARAVIATSQQIVDDARPDIDAILKNVEQATRHFNEVTTAEIDELMAGWQTTVVGFQDIATKANLFFDEQAPQLSATLTNVRLASLDGRLFVSEIRAQPQRLLRPPNKKELERELLYSSARAYASAASDLQSASAALDNVLSSVGAGNTPVSPADIVALQKRLHDAFANYEAAESELLDAIINKAPKP